MNEITLQRWRQWNDYWFPRLFVWSIMAGATWWMIRPSVMVAVMGLLVVPVVVAVTSYLFDVILDTVEDDLEVRRFHRELDEWRRR